MKGKRVSSWSEEKRHFSFLSSMVVDVLVVQILQSWSQHAIFSPSPPLFLLNLSFMDKNILAYHFVQSSRNRFKQKDDHMQLIILYQPILSLSKGNMREGYLLVDCLWIPRQHLAKPLSCYLTLKYYGILDISVLSFAWKTLPQVNESVEGHFGPLFIYCLWVTNFLFILSSLFLYFPHCNQKLGISLFDISAISLLS